MVWTQQSGDSQVDAVDTTSILGAFTGENLHAINYLNKAFDKKMEEIIKLNGELEQTRKEHEAHVVDLMKISEDKYNVLREMNTSLQDELLSEMTANAVFVQRIPFLEKQCEYENASAASSSFSKFSQEEFKELALKTSQERHELINELFKTLDSVFESHFISLVIDLIKFI